MSLQEKVLRLKEPREVTINYIKLLNTDLENNTAEILVGCTKGTYIRTLCNDIGEKLGCGAHMTSLVRTKCGGFSIEESLTLEEFETLFNEGKAEAVLISPEKILQSKGVESV